MALSNQQELNLCNFLLPKRTAGKGSDWRMKLPDFPRQESHSLVGPTPSPESGITALSASTILLLPGLYIYPWLLSGLVAYSGW